MLSRIIKRIFDLLFVLVVVVIGFIPMTVLIFKAWRRLGSPLLFTQERPGLHGKVFRMYKLRTMTNERDVQGNLLPDEQRMTPFGKTLRRISADEVPAILNILRGEMSAVGPRPLLVQYLPLYSKEQARRHEVKPGLTGWAQVNGRNAVSWQERFAMDVWYVENQSLALDLRILGLTFKKAIFRHQDVNSKTAATMEAFTGNH